MPLDSNVRCLFFDVFGTCVDWRKTVTNALNNAARESLSTSADGLDSDVKSKTSAMVSHVQAEGLLIADTGQQTCEQWGDFAQQWRGTYLTFTRAVAADSSLAWKTVDQHHLDSLYDLLADHGLVIAPNNSSKGSRAGPGSLWPDERIHELSLIWHRLEPWPDTCQGIRHLNTRFQTGTLTNGNLALIRNMVAHGGMEFAHVFSAEMFSSYKPNPAVYLGAAGKLGLQASECALVAAHLDDLAAAKKVGFGTVYVERPREESHPELRDQGGLVDVCVQAGEDGFVTVARRLGVPVE